MLPAVCGNLDISCLIIRAPAIIAKYKRVFSIAFVCRVWESPRLFIYAGILHHIIASIFWSVVWISSIENMFSIFKSVVLIRVLETIWFLVLFLCIFSILGWVNIIVDILVFSVFSLLFSLFCINLFVFYVTLFYLSGSSI